MGKQPRFQLPAVAAGTALALAVVLAAAGVDAAEPTFYRYTDENGVTVLNNIIPPRYVKQGYEVVNRYGDVLKVVPPPRTEEEILEDRRLERERQEQERIAQKKREMDRLLLMTYASEDDLLGARDGKLNALASQLNVARHNREYLDERLARLQRHAAEHERIGEAVPKKLLDEIASTEAQIGRNQSFIEARSEQHAAVEQEFAQARERYRELMQLSPGERQALLGRGARP